MRTHLARSLMVLGVFLAVVGPGQRSGAAPEAAPAPPPPSPAAGTAAAAGKGAGELVGPPKVAWKDMTTAQKTRYMKEVVTPKMKVSFQAFDAEEFKKFDCSTCHGKTAKARKYKMPNPSIHSLPGTPEAFMKMMNEKPTWPKWTKFMSEQVVPETAALLGLPAFDPKKPVEGAFSCDRCHVLKKP